ncbi:MAG: DUF3108 domain-containing protein [Ignavibacteriae bacterium]|nr:MAG: DUF3108 domain-containing protein [Ignavibacteriota bacterium]
MKFLKSILLVLVLLLVISNVTFSQKEVFYDGEELFYDVYYSFINIGWVKINTSKSKDNKNVYVSTAVMRSNEALPFVSASYDFRSEMEVVDNAIRPLHFEAKEYNGSSYSYLTYNFDYDSSIVGIKKIGFNGNIEYEKKLELGENYQDGLSIFYYSRFSFFKNDSKVVPVLFNQDLTNLTLNFDANKTDASIGQVDYDVSSHYLTGNTDYELVFGLTGDFSGWFTNDKASVPIKANLQVKIGNITLELKDWKRGSWRPPEF